MLEDRKGRYGMADLLAKEQKVDYITQHISLNKDIIMQFAEESMIDDLFNAFVDMKKTLQ